MKIKLFTLISLLAISSTVFSETHDSNEESWVGRNFVINGALAASAGYVAKLGFKNKLRPNQYVGAQITMAWFTICNVLTTAATYGTSGPSLTQIAVIASKPAALFLAALKLNKQTPHLALYIATAAAYDMVF